MACQSLTGRLALRSEGLCFQFVTGQMGIRGPAHGLRLFIRPAIQRRGGLLPRTDADTGVVLWVKRSERASPNEAQRLSIRVRLGTYGGQPPGPKRTL